MVSINNIKIYIINLKNRTDRKKHMINLLTKIGFINYEFIEPLAVNEDTIKLLKNRSITKYMSKNAISLTLTHIYILNNTNHKLFFIMEDDIINTIPINKVLTKINYIIKNVPNNTDMIRLEMCAEKCSKMKLFKNDIFKLYSPYCAACILFFESGKNKIIKYLNDINNFSISLIQKILKEGWCIDHFYRNLNKNGKLISYGYYPPIFKQLTSFGSDIKGSTRNYSIFSNNDDKACTEEFFHYKIKVIMIILLICIILYYIYKNKLKK